MCIILLFSLLFFKTFGQSLLVIFYIDYNYVLLSLGSAGSKTVNYSPNELNGSYKKLHFSETGLETLVVCN